MSADPHALPASALLSPVGKHANSVCLPLNKDTDTTPQIYPVKNSLHPELLIVRFPFVVLAGANGDLLATGALDTLGGGIAVED